MSAVDMFWAAPPVTRTLTAATVVLSASVFLFNVVPVTWVIYLNSRVFTLSTIPEIWRLVTPFLLTGPKLALIMSPFFLYRYSSALETETPRLSGPGDYCFYLIFVCSIILPTAGYYFQSWTLLPPLTLAMAYTQAQENPNQQVTFFIVTFASKWLPWAMLALTLLSNGPEAAYAEATGLLAAHAWEFFTRIWPEYGGGPRLVQTPAFLQRLFAAAPGTATQRGFGTAFAGNAGARPAQSTQQNRAGNTAGGWASGSSWSSRGAGRRLGGE